MLLKIRGDPMTRILSQLTLILSTALLLAQPAASAEDKPVDSTLQYFLSKSDSVYEGTITKITTTTSQHNSISDTINYKVKIGKREKKATKE